MGKTLAKILTSVVRGDTVLVHDPGSQHEIRFRGTITEVFLFTPEYKSPELRVHVTSTSDGRSPLLHNTAINVPLSGMYRMARNLWGANY